MESTDFYYHKSLTELKALPTVLILEERFGLQAK